MKKVSELVKVISPEDYDDKIEAKAFLLMAKFLSEVEHICNEQSIHRKDLAGMIGSSPSHINQLFRGDKLINLKTLAKLEEALGVSFQVSHKKIKQ